MLETVNLVKATNREASHVDEKVTPERVEAVQQAVDSSRVEMVEGLQATERRILDALAASNADQDHPTDLAHALLDRTTPSRRRA